MVQTRKIEIKCNGLSKNSSEFNNIRKMRTENKKGKLRKQKKKYVQKQTEKLGETSNANKALAVG